MGTQKKGKNIYFFQLVEETIIIAKMLYFVIQFYLHYFYSRFVQENTGFTGTALLNKLFSHNVQQDNELKFTYHSDENCRWLRLHCSLQQQKYPSTIPGLQSVQVANMTFYQKLLFKFVFQPQVLYSKLMLYQFVVKSLNAVIILLLTKNVFLSGNTHPCIVRRKQYENSRKHIHT